MAAQHYNYFRDYDPSLGRYLQPDPLGVSGLLALGRLDGARLDPTIEFMIPTSGLSESALWNLASQSQMQTLAADVQLFGYVNGRPVALTDPLGLAPGNDREKNFKKCMRKCEVKCDGELGKCQTKLNIRRKAVCMARAYARYFICVAGCTAKYVPDLYDDDDDK